MYKHIADSIKESSNRMFISSEEKTKYNNYENILRKKEDSYSKTEVDNKIKELSDNTYGNVEGEFISESNTIDGYVKDLEILGNTVQNQDNLADIKSVGILQEDGTYKIELTSCGKNLFNVNESRFVKFRYESWIDDGEIKNETTATITRLDNNSFSVSSGRTGLYAYYGFYVEIKVGKTYKVTFDRTINRGAVCVYNKTLNKVVTYCEHTDQNTLKNFTISDNGEYYLCFSDFTDPVTFKNVYLTEEGSIATSYEPYKESRVDINLPCQLEKVGDVSDRLYYDEEEKVWCIEKNIGTVIFDGSEHINIINTERTLTNYVGLKSPGMKPVNNTPIILDKFKFEEYGYTKDYEYGYSWVMDGITYVYVHFLKSKGSTIDEFRGWMKNNNILVKYQLETPQKIILPLSTQIQLNSYADRTHIYTVSGEVEPTIKATLPKSLGSSVQSLNDKTDIMIERIEAIETLKEGQNLSYESDKGYVVCENTNNGQVDNIKIEGKTLVNLHPNYTPSLMVPESDENTFTITKSTGYIKITGTDLTSSYYRYINFGKINFDLFEPNTTYTLVFKKLKGVGPISLQDGNADNSITGYFNTQDNKLIYTFKTKEVIEKSNQILYLWIDPNLTTMDIEVEGPMIFKGNLSNSLYYGYFEGLMSVNNGDKNITITSRKENGNLFQFNIMKGYINLNGTFNDNVTTWIRSVTPMELEVGREYSISSDILGRYSIFFYDYNMKFVNYFPGVTKFTVPVNGKYMLFMARKSVESEFTDNELNSIQITINRGDTVISYEPHKSHNKSLLYYNDLGELVPVPELHEWDSIEKHSDGKWYYHKRSEKVVLNGSESWIEGLPSQFTDTHMFFACSSFDKIIKTEAEVISDKFVYGATWDILSRECIDSVTEINKLRIRISKSKLSTQDVAGFKQWLQANNVTVVYQLAQEKVYECVNLNLDTYDNETMVMVNTGAITPNISLNVSSHIGNTVSILRERLKAVEEEYIQYKLNKDRLLLNARYKSDKGSFNLSIITLSSNIEEIDYELFELAKSVIELSLDKIDIVYIENLIDFYTLVGKFDYDMADVLFEMIENQINTPVIEIPEEEISIEI